MTLFEDAQAFIRRVEARLNDPEPDTLDQELDDMRDLYERITASRLEADAGLLRFNLKARARGVVVGAVYENGSPEFNELQSFKTKTADADLVQSMMDEWRRTLGEI